MFTCVAMSKHHSHFIIESTGKMNAPQTEQQMEIKGFDNSLWAHYNYFIDQSMEDDKMADVLNKISVTLSLSHLPF